MTDPVILRIPVALALVWCVACSDKTTSNEGKGGSNSGGTAGASSGTTSTGGSAGTAGGGDTGGTSGEAGGGGSAGSGTSGSAGAGGTSGTAGSGGSGGGGGTTPCKSGPSPVVFVCEGGDDNGPGTESEPFATFDAARDAFANLEPGQSVAFCRGGTFQRSAGEWVNPNCTATNRCGIIAYGDASSPLPVLEGSGDGLSFANGGNADHEEGYVVTDLDIRGSGSGTGIFFYNDIDDVTLCGLEISGFATAINLQRGNMPNAGSDGENDRISLLNSRIIGNTTQGWLGACNDCVIEDNYFEGNGGASDPANRDHSIYLDSHRPISGMVIRGNELYRTTASRGQCEGAPFTAHGNFTDLLIEDNHVHEDEGTAANGCWGIVPDTGYGSEAESFTRVVIRNNLVEHVGNVGIGVNACDECVIEGNTVLQSVSGSGISSPHRTGDASDAPDGVVTFRNNTVTLTGGGQCFNYGPTVVDGGGNECL